MDIATTLRKLVALEESQGTVVSLTLDLAGRGQLPSETRVFLKKEFESNLFSEARPERVRSALRNIARRVMTFVASGIDPGSKGLYLIAGREAWVPVELKIPLKNFVTVGTHAYLPPFLAAEARHPRAYVVEANANEAILHELYLGDSQVVRTLASSFRKEPQERLRTPRSKEHLSTGPGRGGSARDREQQRQEESHRSLLHQAAEAVKELHASRPAEAIYLAGPEDAFGEFSSRLSPELKSRAMALGARGGNSLERASLELKVRAASRLEGEMLEFHERRAQGLQVALGPGDVLNRLFSGEVERVYLDEYDPVPGVHCTGCGSREPRLRLRCPYCSLDVVPTSITQDIVTHGRTHPPLDVTFVGHNAGWLRDLDGMAALLSTKGAPRRTTPALK